MELDPAIAAHYRQDPERDRLETWARLEGIRTRELLRRFLPSPPAVVYDIGGGAGAYALPLAQQGYEVHLLDPWPPHIEAADAASRAATVPLASAVVGDARELPFDDASAHAVLMLGPLYHLPEPRDRARTLAEAHRVLEPGGLVMAAAISRFASTIDGIHTGAIADPAFDVIVEGDLRDGVHENPDPEAHPDWFTLAYFHRPEGLTHELQATGFEQVETLAIEGPAAFRDIDEQLDDPAKQAALLRAIERVETEPALLGASAHLMGVALRPGSTCAGRPPTDR